MMPANAGAEADVPATPQKLMNPCESGRQEPSRQSKYGSCIAAVREISGKSRFPSLGPNPDCQEGFEKNMLLPPPVDHRPASVPQVDGVQLSFQTFSGIYDKADPRSIGLFVALQYLLSWPCSLNMVPPIATVYGLDASTFTEGPKISGVTEGSSQPAEPESPDETR